MSIFFNTKKTTEPVIESKTFDNIFPTTESLDMILTESAKDSYTIRAGMYMSDVVLEEQVMEGVENVEVLLEGVVKSAWERIKALFTSLLQKLKDWYNKVKRYLEILFTGGKEFVDKFEKEINAKETKGFEYSGFKYTFNEGVSKVSGILEKTDKVADQYMNKLKGDAALEVGAQGKAMKDNAGDKEYNTSEEKEALLKDCGADSMQGVVDLLYKAYRDGKENHETIKDFGGNSKSEMLQTIKNKDSMIKSIETNQQKVEARINRVIKAIDAASKQAKGEDAGRVTSYATHATEMIRYTVTVASTAVRVQVDTVKAAARDFETVLKGFLHFKPAKKEAAKEGTTEPGVGDGEVSILESVIKFI